jgi:polar amino acid transport system permease protein
MSETIGFGWLAFWHLVWPPYAFQNPLIWKGLLATIFMSVTAEIIGVLLGLVLALMLRSKLGPLRWGASGYLYYFRGTPLIVQLAILFFGLSAIGLYRFPDIEIFSIGIAGAIQAGTLGLGLNEAAYMAEIIRAGILSIDSGQMEAAQSIGMTPGQAMMRIIMPQAFRVIVPPLGNNFNSMMKSTTLVSTIGGAELFRAYQLINSQTFQPFETFLAASVFYLVLTIGWGYIQKAIERKVEYLS